MVHRVIEANDSGSVRPDDLPGSRLAVEDLPGSRLVNAEMMRQLHAVYGEWLLKDGCWNKQVNGNSLCGNMSYTNDDYCYELEKGLKCFLKCYINMRLPTFLFIKMRRRPLEFIIEYGRSKDKKKAIEIIPLQRQAWTPLDMEEDFLEVVWKSSWKSSSALYFRRLTGRDMGEDSVRRLPGSPDDLLEVVWKTSWKSSGRLPRSRLADYILDD
ncbi:hypothetical protein F2Q70_00034560 [Brassica cretica]|uniref:Uncharacterized protein n=1 Tax=Brassica cretica TaxID=69181 RepID=A0A8S9JSG1_BRACR|nr:hypothetical protein F2Q70_00034560 [Brassica cretica]